MTFLDMVHWTGEKIYNIRDAIMGSLVYAIYSHIYLGKDLFNFVKLVKTAPKSDLSKSHENLAHRHVGYFVRAVEDDEIKFKGSSVILGGLSLSSTSGSC